MSFHSSSSNIRVDDGHILRASVRNNNGEQVDSELDLNNYLGNNNGRFEWGGKGKSLCSCFSLHFFHQVFASATRGCPTRRPWLRARMMVRIG